MRALAVVLAALTTGTALKLTNGGMLTRRNFAALGATPLALVLPAHASYLMNQAAQNEQSWKATPKSQERAVYARIEAAIDEKRPFRDDEGTLGYVGGEYTKKSAADRIEFEKEQLEKKQQASVYAKPEDVQLMDKYGVP